MASVYAVTSGKGGSGKTAVACGLAAAFAEQGKRTVLVELDSGHRCCDYLFQLDEAVAFDLSDVQSGHCTLLTAVYSTGLEGLDLLAAPYRPEVLFSPEMLQGVCNELSLYYDCVVLDAPAIFWWSGLFPAAWIWRCWCAPLILCAFAPAISCRFCWKTWECRI